MKLYAHNGFTDFVFCLGYRGNMIKEYFLNYEAMNNDFSLCLGRNSKIEYKNVHREQDFQVTLVDTGPTTMTGGRVKRIEKYIGRRSLHADLWRWRERCGHPRARGVPQEPWKAGHGHDHHAEFPLRSHRHKRAGRVTKFKEKAKIAGRASAGFFVLDRRVFDYLGGDDCIFEKEPLERLADEGQLMAYQHDGFFYAMDTYREYEYLNQLWSAKQAPWKVWQE
jgi:glucose-1-phosphate cytidylyltransferase